MNEKTLRGSDIDEFLSGPIGFARSKGGAIFLLALGVINVASATIESEMTWAQRGLLLLLSVFFSNQLFLCFGVLANFRTLLERFGGNGQLLKLCTFLIVTLIGYVAFYGSYRWFSSDPITMYLAFVLVAALLSISIGIPLFLVCGFRDLWVGRDRLVNRDKFGFLIGIVSTALLLYYFIGFTADYYSTAGLWQGLSIQSLGVLFILPTIIGVPAALQTWASTSLVRGVGRVSPVLSVVLLAVMFIGIGGTLYGWQSVKHERVYLKTQVVDDVVYLPPPTALRVASLGYGAAWGDLLFVRTHAYYLRHMYGDQIFQWLETYADAVITLDPDNAEIYYWASQVVRYGQSVSETIISRSNKFAEQGLRRFPDDARLYVHLGFNQYFELRPMLLDKEQSLREELKTITTSKRRSEVLERLNFVRTQRNELEEQALVNYTTAAMLPHSAIDPIFLFDLYIKQDQTEAAVHIAKSLYFDLGEQNRKQLLERLKIAGRGEDASVLKTAEERYNKSMPYVSPELYRMVGSTDNMVVPNSWDRLGEFFEALDAVRDESRTEEIL